MSQPPPYGAPNANPDKRPLPQGWVERYDERYQTWFYVNTHENPPRSSWVHPLGPPPPQPSGYAPPTGPPPPNNSYSPYPPQAGYSQGYNQSPQPQWGQSAPPGGGYYGSPPQSGYSMYGQPPQDTRFFGSNSPQPSYAPQSSAPGMKTALIAGGAGLVGGALLMDAFEDRERDAYQDGYNQGYDNGDDQGDGGGDW